MTLIESWSAYMSLLHDRAPVTAQAVRAPRSASDRRDIELTKVPWNDELREFYSLQDGQRQTHGDEPDVGTVLPQLWLLGIDDVVEHHARCRETQFYTDHLGADWPRIARDQPAGAVVSMFRDTYVPFATTGDGNYLCVDTGSGEHHGCVREFSLEFADEGGPLFTSLDAYVDWVRLNVHAVKDVSLSAPRIDAGVLRWDAVPPPPPPETPQPARTPLYIPFDLIQFLPSEVGPDDDIVDLDVVAEKVLETARTLHPGAEIEGGRTVFPRVPRVQGANMNCFVMVDGEPVVYFTVVTGHGDEVFVHELPVDGGFELVDEFGYPIVREEAAGNDELSIPTTFTRASFYNRNAPLRPDHTAGNARPSVPDLHDYAWADNSELTRYMFDVYCLTVITDITISEFLTLIPTPTIVGECDYPTLEDRGMDIFREHTPGGAQGLFEYEGSVVMFESNGWVGVSPEVVAPVSVGRTVVAHHLGGNNGGAVQWYVDGELRTAFELYDARGRDGEHPDQLVPLMRAIGGFNLDYDEDAEDAWMDLPYMQAAFALAEALTGIRLTLDLLRESTYLSLDFPIPD